MSLSKKSHLSACLEAVSGTAATAPQLYIPCKSNFKAKVNRIYPPEERGTRDGNYVVEESTQFDDVDVKGAWYNDTFALFLIGLLGADTPTQPDVTGVPTVWKHTIALSDIPQTLTLWKSYDVQDYFVKGAGVSKLSLKNAADNKLVEADWTLKSNRHQKWAGAALAPTYSTLKPFVGYKPVIKINGVQSLDLTEFDIEIDQKVDPFYAVGGGADFSKLYFGERTAKVNFTARFDATTLYDNYENGTDVHFNFLCQGALIGNSGGGGTPPNTDYYQELEFDFPIVGFDEVEHDLSKDIVEIKGKCTARPGATANSLLTAYIQNTIAAYTPA